MKLRTKITCLFTLLITISFLFFFLTVRFNIEHTNRTITESLSTQVIETTASEAGNWLGQRISELRMIALTDSVLEEDIQQLRPYIHRLNTSIGTSFGNEWGTLAIGYTDGFGWVSDDITIDVSDRDYFKKAMSTDSEYVLSSPVISKTDEAPIVLICYPLRNRQGQTFGFLNGAVSLRKLTELVSQIDFYQGDSWIMDSNGVPYTAPETYPSDQILSDLAPVLQQNPSASTMQWHSEAENKTVFFTAIPSTDNWFLCTAVDRHLLMQDTNHLLTVIFTAWLVLLAFSLVCCLILSRSITKPVLLLTQIMNQVEQGQVDTRFPLRGKDELTLLGHSFNHMLDRLQQLMARIRQEEQEKRNAEFKVLQAQINPHFLYNTLDTLQWKAYEHDDDEMVNLITALSSFFRISLSKGKEIIPLTKEIEHIKNYLYIQQIRFEDMLTYEISCQVDSDAYSIVKLTLQPLVENAIQHGMKPKLEPCHISITIDSEQEVLKLTVQDDGVGIPPEKLARLQLQLDSDTPSDGFGLYNVHKRLRLVYGSDYGITLDSLEHQWTRITVRIPAGKEVFPHGSNPDL